MILPKTTLAKIERGKFEKILESLAASKFTGYVKVAFKKLELCSGEVLFESGKISAAEIIKIRSKSSIYGDSALSELLTLDNCVVEIYPLDFAQVKKSIEMNQIAIVKEPSIIKKIEPEKIVPTPASTPPATTPSVSLTQPIERQPEIDRDKVLQKFGITTPENGEIRRIIEDSIGDSELILEVEDRPKAPKAVNLEQEKILQKYGIKKPSDEEIDFLISNALGLEEEEIEEKDFETLKKELIELITSKVGKPSKKTVSIIESCKSYDELIDMRSELEKSLRALVMFVPRETINQIILEVEKKLGRKIS